MVPQFNPNTSDNASLTPPDYENVLIMENSFGNYGNSIIPEENASYASYEEASHSMHINNWQWALQDAGDLESMAFSYIQHS
jgi:hypothetical protein